MKKLFSLSMALVLLFVFSGFAMAAQYSYIDTPPAVRALGATAVAQTYQPGQTVCGVRIEYPGEILAGTVKFTDFEVDGYDVIALYVNNDGVWQNAEAKGKYIFLEFAVSQIPGYTDGKTMQYYDGINRRRPIVLNVRQAAPVTLIDGRVADMNMFTNDSEINLLADDFLELSFTNPVNGKVLEYRLFVPEGYESKAGKESLPLVLFLHGGGEEGDTNISQLLANTSALEFVYPEAQAKNPCFVLAPQKPSGEEGWSYNAGTDEAPNFMMPDALESVKLLIDQLIGQYAIDTSRMYCTGLSNGAGGTYSLNQEYPDMFAAMLCIASGNPYSDEQFKAMKDKPLWFVMSADETEARHRRFAALKEGLERQGVKPLTRLNEDGQAWNGYLRGYPLELKAKEQWDAAIEAGTTTLMTQYVPGTVVPDPHGSWMATYSNAVIRDWLFSFKLETPYQP